MRLMVAFFLLALIVSLQQAVSATETCSVTSDGTVTMLTGGRRNMVLSPKKILVLEIIDEDNPNCDLLVRTRQNANGEISWVAVRLIAKNKGEIRWDSLRFIGNVRGGHERAYQFDLLSQKVIMRGQGFTSPETIENYPHTWPETGITVTETVGGWILTHSECGYEITVAEMEDHVLDIKVPDRDQLPYAVGPCALSDDCDVEFIGIPDKFFLRPSVFELIGVCDGRNLYKAFQKSRVVIYLHVCVSYNYWVVGRFPCEKWANSYECHAHMLSRTALSTPENAPVWEIWRGQWMVVPTLSAQCSTKEPNQEPWVKVH